MKPTDYEIEKLDQSTTVCSAAGKLSLELGWYTFFETSDSVCCLWMTDV